MDELDELLAEGFIDQDEYDEKKAELLGSSSSGANLPDPIGDSGSQCQNCHKKLCGKVVTVRKGFHFHQHCFVCAHPSCDASLATTQFFEVGGLALCAQHVSQSNGSCPCCNNAIVGAYVEVDGVQYHQKCFRCTVCNAALERGYTIGADGSPLCPAHSVEAGDCAYCNQPIGGDGKIRQLGSNRFHLECWVCSFCHNPIGDQYYKAKSIPYCHECFRNLFS